jgi:hypothetical protein
MVTVGDHLVPFGVARVAQLSPDETMTPGSVQPYPTRPHTSAGPQA